TQDLELRRLRSRGRAHRTITAGAQEAVPPPAAAPGAEGATPRPAVAVPAGGGRRDRAGSSPAGRPVAPGTPRGRPLLGRTAPRGPRARGDVGAVAAGGGTVG